MCEGECGATEEHVMQFDWYDVMRIQVARDKPLSMCGHHPLVAGRQADGRLSYVFELYPEDDLWYPGSGPTAEEARFLQRSPEANFILASPSLSDKLSIYVLRYDLSAYMDCVYYVDKMRIEDTGMDAMGPFSWRFRRYLPAFSDTHTNPEDCFVGDWQ